jgi:hypothetical protein
MSSVNLTLLIAPGFASAIDGQGPSRRKRKGKAVHPTS